jgi:hypothetical protein
MRIPTSQVVVYKWVLGLNKQKLKIIKLQMKIIRQDKQVITIQFFRGGFQMRLTR